MKGNVLAGNDVGNVCIKKVNQLLVEHTQICVELSGKFIISRVLH